MVYGGKVIAVWFPMSVVCPQHCCGTTTTALMLATLASAEHCIICSDRFVGKVCFLSMVKPGYDAILVFVDRLTKYVHIVPTTAKCTAKTWADLFIQHLFCNHGLPLEVISHRGPQFAGKYNQALSDRLCISWNMSTAFHSQTDGQTERMNRTVEDMLRHFVSPTMTTWNKLLMQAHFAINNAWQESV